MSVEHSGVKRPVLISDLVERYNAGDTLQKFAANQNITPSREELCTDGC